MDNGSRCDLHEYFPHPAVSPAVYDKAAPRVLLLSCCHPDRAGLTCNLPGVRRPESKSRTSCA